MKNWLYYVITFIIIISIGLAGYYSVSMVKNLAFLISTLQNRIEIYEQYRQEELEKLKDNDISQLEIDDLQRVEIKNLTKVLIKLGILAKENDERQSQLAEDISGDIDEIQKAQSKIKNELKTKKQITLVNVEEIKKANVIIYNTLMGVSGSGSHIIIKGKDYILTAAHVIKNEDDFIWAHLDDNAYHPLELIKINRKRDLALFRIYGVENLPYLEISNEFPTEGSEVVIVGNPANLTDIITDGVIAKVRKKTYLFTNKIYFGNSGGAILYKGKIVGVVTGINVYFQFPAIVNYGSGAKLEIIKEFLDIK